MHTCKEMAPVLKKANADYKGKAIIKFVDVWKYPIQQTVSHTGYTYAVFINADGTPYVPSKDLVSNSYNTTAYIRRSCFTVHQGGLTEAQMEAILADMGAVK
jgi:thioredoxin 1